MSYALSNIQGQYGGGNFPTAGSGATGALQADGKFILYVDPLGFAGEDFSVAASSGSTGVLGIANKPIPSLTYSTLLSSSFGTSTSTNAKSSGGNVFAFFASSISTSIRYFQIHNKATAPVTNDVPVYSFPIPAGSSGSPSYIVIGTDFFTINGDWFSTGISWSLSQSNGLYNPATNTDHTVFLKYI